MNTAVIQLLASPGKAAFAARAYRMHQLDIDRGIWRGDSGGTALGLERFGKAKFCLLYTSRCV